MRDEITQGSIITYVRSLKYPHIPCYGIVISARCDLANSKIKSMHLLTALPLNMWFEQVLFYDVVEENLRKLYNQIKTYALKYKMDYSSLLDLGPQKAQICFDKNVTNRKDRDKAEELCRTWSELLCSRSSEMKTEEKKQILVHNEKFLTQQFRSLQHGSCTKYCFIPRKAYEVSDASLTDGLVVDLYDIQQIGIEHKGNIEAGKYDYQTLVNEDKRDELNKLFSFLRWMIM